MTQQELALLGAARARSDPTQPYRQRSKLSQEVVITRGLDRARES